MGEFKVPGLISSSHNCSYVKECPCLLMSLADPVYVLSHSWTLVMFMTNQVSLSLTTDLCVIYICSEDAVVWLMDIRV